jgi:predicted small lipoprotein YifL
MLASARRSGIVRTFFTDFGDRWVQVKQSVGRSMRLALVAVMTAALGLAACGRKGPLDPPPTAAPNPPPANAPPQAGERPPNATAPTAAAPPPPAAAQPAQKTFFLDFLIGK